MTVKVDNEKTEVLLTLLNEARGEADNLRKTLEKYKRIILATRLIMGHELKRPTTSISGYLDLALEDLEMWAGCEAVENIKKARDDCELLDELNEFFLELLRIDIEEQELNIRKMDVHNLIEGVITGFPVKYRAKSRVKVSVAEGADSFYFNPNALKLIFSNLIENALIYSPQNSQVIVEVERVRERRGVTGGNIMMMRVIDHGIGVPEEYLQKIFHPFVRVPSATAEGSGLGLTLVRSLIELYGGEVSIKSKNGEGTTVHLSVPELRKKKQSTDGD